MLEWIAQRSAADLQRFLSPLPCASLFGVSVAIATRITPPQSPVLTKNKTKTTKKTTKTLQKTSAADTFDEKRQKNYNKTRQRTPKNVPKSSAADTADDGIEVRYPTAAAMQNVRKGRQTCRTKSHRWRQNDEQKSTNQPRPEMTDKMRK